MSERKIKLQIKDMTKKYDNGDGVEHINLDIYEGEIVTFLGPSGCGKTTILRTIGGFLDVTSGDITIDGQSIIGLPPEKRPTAMVFQSYNLWPHMTIYENLAFGLKLRKVPKAEIDANIKKMLALVSMSGCEKKYPNQMSGGQQQRVAVARALVMKPDVLLLDEPLSNLDAKLRESVRVELRTIQQKMGLSVIYVTHDQSEALSMSDAVVVLKDGEVHQVGTPQEIYFEPKTQFVADFIGTTNLISVEGKGNNDVAYGNTVFHSTNPVTPGARYVASVRPESIKISLEKAEGKVNIKTSIVNRMFLGEKVRYFVKDELDKEWIVDMFDPGKTLLSGDAYVTFKAEKAWVIEDK